MSEPTSGYPKPRWPEPKHASSVDELLPAARRAVRRTYGTGALGTARAGERMLIATPPGQDPLVLEAVIRAFKEVGVAADAVTEEALGLWPPYEKIPRQSAADGWKEILVLMPSARAFFEPLRDELKSAGPLRPDYRAKYQAYLDEHPEYDGLFCKQGGPAVTAKDRENWLYVTVDDLLAGSADWPGDVQKLVERKTVEKIPQAAEVRITDAEGTDVSFPVAPEEAALWMKGAANRRGHLLMYPYYASIWYYRYAKLPEGPLVFPKMNGVIAGTSGYYGFFPQMRSYVEDGVIRRVEGGGLFGDLIRELMDRTKDMQFPKAPRRGYMYMNELSLGTEAKRVRPRDIFDTVTPLPVSPQRLRSGVFHWGPGLESYDPAAVQWCLDHKVPTMHCWNYMTFFNTFRMRLRSGEWVTLIEKGHLTALDDPEVRSLASRYGNPDQLLTEDWVPAIPGVNYPGDYLKDFASDPARFARAEALGQLT